MDNKTHHKCSLATSTLSCHHDNTIFAGLYGLHCILDMCPASSETLCVSLQISFMESCLVSCFIQVDILKIKSFYQCSVPAIVAYHSELQSSILNFLSANIITGPFREPQPNPPIFLQNSLSTPVKAFSYMFVCKIVLPNSFV